MNHSELYCSQHSRFEKITCRYEEAIYFYGEAARRILELLGQKKVRKKNLKSNIMIFKILPILRKNALEYVERAEFLKKELPRLQAELSVKRM